MFQHDSEYLYPNSVAYSENRFMHHLPVTVGPNSKQALYQQQLITGGITVLGSVLSTSLTHTQAVTISYVVEPQAFVKGIKVRGVPIATYIPRTLSFNQVVYGTSLNDAPAGCIREFHKNNDSEINGGWGGKSAAFIVEST